jgi:hypothetical protein
MLPSVALEPWPSFQRMKIANLICIFWLQTRVEQGTWFISFTYEHLFPTLPQGLASTILPNAKKAFSGFWRADCFNEVVVMGDMTWAI